MAAVMWITLMVALYYWGHKPFDAQQITTLAMLALDVLLAGAVTALSGGVGRRLFRLLAGPEPGEPTRELAPAGSGLEQAVLHAAAGMGVFSLLWLAMGAAGLFYRGAAWLILLAGCALFRKDIRLWWADAASAADFWRRGGRLDRVLILFLAVMILLQLMWAAAPPIKYDALTYHLQLPRQYIAAHRFTAVPENPYWGHPQTGEMLFTWMMLLQRGQTAALTGAVWGILTLLGTAATARKAAGHWLQTGAKGSRDIAADETQALRAGLIAAAALALGATFRGLMGWAYVDLLSALMGWAALAALLRSAEEATHPWIVWAGVFCGLAVSVKWTGGVAALGVFAFLLLERRKEGYPWRLILLAAALMTALVLPWLIKNMAVTGSPVYPYFVPTESIPAQRLAASGAGDSSVGLLEGALFPLSSTVMGFDSAAGFGADLGPLLALLALPGLWALRKQPAARILALGLGLVWVIIAAGSLIVNHLQQTRLYFALLPWAAVAAGAGWLALTGVRSRLLRVETLLTAMLALMLAFTGLQELNRLAQNSPLAVLTGAADQPEYLADSLGWYAPALQSLYELPVGSKALMLWEARGYYAPLGTAADAWIDRWRADYWAHGSAEDILAAWKQQGFTHVLYYQSGAELVRETDKVLEAAGWQELDRLTSMLPSAQVFGDAYILYQLP